MALDFPTSPSPNQVYTAGAKSWSWDNTSGAWLAVNAGIQGPQGTQGTLGTQGAQGLQGITGANGSNGSQGTQGIQGLLGIQGAQGTQGLQGIQGIQGSQGVQGIQGIQGITGIQGAIGSQGTQGTQGLQGIQGISGASILGTNNTFTGTNAFTTLSASGTATFRDAVNTYSLNVSGDGGTQIVAFGNASSVPRIQAFTAGFAAATHLNIQPAGGDTNVGGLLTVGAGAAITGTLSCTTGANFATSSGSVGIGTASPVSKLDVVETATIKRVTSANFMDLNFYNAATAGVGVVAKIRCDGDNLSNEIGALAFHTGSLASGVTERLRIDSSGNVGIGTASPAASASSKATVEASGCLVVGGAINAHQTNRGVFQFGGNTTSIRSYGDTAGTGIITFSQGGGGNADTERMRINSSGNVGIGTANPLHKLQVTQALDGNFPVLGTGKGALFIAGDSNLYGMYLGINTSTGDGFIQTMRNNTATAYNLILNSAGGNVGINTTSPNAKLEVVGAASVTSFTGSTALGFRITGATSTNDYSGIDFSSSTAIPRARIGSYFAGGGSYLVFGTSNNYSTGITNSAMTIDYSGNVGVGTTTPSGKFNVAGVTSYDAGLNIDGTAASGVGLSLRNAAGNNWYLISTGSGNGGGANNLGFYNGNSSNYLFYITSTGNVGIGTTSPGYKLEVNGSFAATTKSFIIDHPTKPGMKLRYGSLEGPENGVYVRDKSSSYTIELPDYWTKLVDPESITVQITPYGAPQNIWVSSIADNTVRIASDTPICTYFYFIQAERIDVEKLEVEI